MPYDCVHKTNPCQICENRVAGISADNIGSILTRLQGNLEYEKTDEPKRFLALHAAGAKKWGWVWFETNRFAIELSIRYKVDYTVFRYAITSLAWGWLISEQS